ncbi:hypothetical protein ACFRCI_39805 [Streptomyces sp. NPDC056638]|uniref:hypothetical protein n=1 Tax=Streptomyces sp. NPDC056638 TaxID=3345887 RepID=UPI0036B69EDF
MSKQVDGDGAAVTEDRRTCESCAAGGVSGPGGAAPKRWTALSSSLPGLLLRGGFRRAALLGGGGLGRVPAVFGGNGLYATVAVAVAGVTVICVYLGVPGIGVGLGVVLALAFRLTAVRFGWNLPNSLDWQPRSKAAAMLRRRTDPASRNGKEEQSHPRKESQ